MVESSRVYCCAWREAEEAAGLNILGSLVDIKANREVEGLAGVGMYKIQQLEVIDLVWDCLEVWALQSKGKDEWMVATVAGT